MTFLSPWFLIGAVSLGVPILVHLVRREQARRVPFPSLMFLRRIPQKSIRRRRLRHRLLLALRCLALLLLALAFARPLIPGGVEGGAGEPGRNLVMLLDTSYSMQYGNRFDQAKKRARSLITAARPKDRVALITFSQGYDVVEPLSHDHDAVLADLAQINPTVNATEYVQALRGAQSLLGGTADRDNVVMLISDFQATGWNRSTVPFSLPAKLIPIDVADGSSSNLACVEVGADPVVYRSKYQGTLLAKLTNFADQPQPARVRFNLNDRLIKEVAVRLDKRASQVVEFTGFTLLDGSNRVTVEVGSDPLPLDNRFFFTIEKTDPLPVLCLEAARGESFYLQQALAVSRNNPYAMTVRTASQMRPADLEKAKVVILNDLTRLDTTVVTRLKRWVERGGGLIIAVGRRVEASAFNQAFSDLSPARLEKSLMPGGGAFELLSQLDTAQPIFAPFAEARSGNFSRVRFYGYFRATPRASSLVLARLSSGDPALIESSLGAGKVLLFTSSLDTSWNDLPLSPMYLPLMHQMLHELHTVKTRGWVRVGETVQVPGAAPGAPVPIDSPTERRLTADDGLSQDGTLFTAREHGFYRLRYPDGEKYVAVNVDFRESDLRKLNLEDFVAAFGGGSKVQAVTAAAEPARPRVQPQEPGRRLWWPLLTAALALFVLEALWAGRIRRQMSETADV